MSGGININNNGTRTPELIVTNILVNETVILYNEKSNSWENLGDEHIVWLGGSTSTPKDSPKCGFGKQCPKSNIGWIVVGCSLPGLFLLLYIAYKIYKKQIYDNDINSTESIIDFTDIKNDIALNTKLTPEEMIEKCGTIDNASGIKKVKAVYREKCIMLKKIHKRNIILKKEIMIELKELRDLNHQNLNQILGVTTKSPNICIIQNWCKKGSLYDILGNEDIHLDWVFKNTFLWDIIKGMAALHDSPIKVHGHLTSKNCLINHRWVVQISDFGLTEFKTTREPPEISAGGGDQAKYEALLWTAPENINFPRNVSQAGDVYSFGIIISEVINRMAPFSAFDDMRPSDLIHFVRKRCIPPFRPYVTIQTGLDPRLIDIMKKCWNEWVLSRPSFKEIKPRMKAIRGEGFEIIDNLIEMMEKYSRDLEKTVKERMEMYKKEKLKTNELLYRCVPKPIVTALLEGSQIVPDEDISITLLLIRIDSFDRLLYWLSPQKVIDVLNDFYKMISQVMEPHKQIYKLSVDREECIFCSNVPGYKNKSERNLLATLAIQLAQARKTCRWRHLGSVVLKFKVTLHSGKFFCCCKI